MDARTRKINAHADLARIVGARMREAREMCNMSQKQAVEQLNPDKSPAWLRRVENATGATRPVNCLILLRAGQLYQVSLDYLLGLTDDFEISPETVLNGHVEKWMGEAWEAARRKDLEKMLWLRRRINLTTTSANVLTSASLKAVAAFNAFIATNP